MTRPILFVLVTVLFSAAFAVNAQERPGAETQRATVLTQSVKPIRAAVAPAAADSSAAATLSAGDAAPASAACCFKQCAGGGNCGKNCKVVDSASQCDLNLVFECPASKGLNCMGGDCTCQ